MGSTVDLVSYLIAATLLPGLEWATRVAREDAVAGAGQQDVPLFQGRPFGKEAAIAKLYTGEMSNRVVNWALQVHGGYGYMDEFPISRLYRDQKILEIGEGTNEVQRMVIARHLGLGTGTSGASP